MCTDRHSDQHSDRDPVAEGGPGAKRQVEYPTRAVCSTCELSQALDGGRTEMVATTGRNADISVDEKVEIENVAHL